MKKTLACLLLALTASVMAEGRTVILYQTATDSIAADTTKNDTTKTTLLQRLQEKKEQIVQNIQEKIDSLKPKAEEAMIKADSILDVRNAKITTDTFYVARPQETWTFRA